MFSMTQSTKYFQCSPLNASPCPLPHIQTPYKKSFDAAMMSFDMTAAQCLYISYVHDSTLLWDIIDAPTTSHDELEHSPILTTMPLGKMIGIISATPWPWHVLKVWYPNHLILHLSHLLILLFRTHIIISMQVPCQFLEPIAQNPPTIRHCNVD
jgi:hypothetical protein